MGGSSPSSVPGASECRNLVNCGRSDRAGRVSLAQHQCGQALAPEARTAPNPALTLAFTSTPSVGPLPSLSYPTCLPATRPANSLQATPQPCYTLCCTKHPCLLPKENPKQGARGGDSNWEGPLSGCPEARRQGARTPPQPSSSTFPLCPLTPAPLRAPSPPPPSLLPFLSFPSLLPPLRLRPDLAGRPVPSRPTPSRPAPLRLPGPLGSGAKVRLPER